MGAGDLTFPARAEVDSAVLGIHAVADHEVIAEAVVPLAHAPVIVVHALGCVVATGGVVDDDYLPDAGLDSAGRGQIALFEGCRRYSAGDYRRALARRQRRLDSRRRGPVSFEQRVRQRSGCDSGRFRTSAQHHDGHASAQRSPLHRAHSLVRRAGARDCSPAHYIVCGHSVQFGLFAQPGPRGYNSRRW